MYRSRPFALGLIGLSACLAHAQVHDVAFTTDDDDDQGFRPTDTALGVNDEAVVITTNMRIQLFPRISGSLVEYQVTDSGFPFITAEDGGPGRFFDPRCEYDASNDRLWFIYMEDNHLCTTCPEFLATVHLAVSRDDAMTTLNTFADTHWYYYTGAAGTTPGNGGVAFDLRHEDIKPYRVTDPVTHQPFEVIADLPAMSIDEQAVYLTPYETSGGTPYCSVVIIPLSHGEGGAFSILDGDRPDESDLTIIRLTDLDNQTEGEFPDNSVEHYAVQEPYLDNAFGNAQFFISNPDKDGLNTGIRLGGLWYNSNASAGQEWQYEQRLNSGETALEDMALNPSGTIASQLRYYESATYKPATPLTAFSPSATRGFHSSAVLVRDANDNPRIFAAHHVIPVDGSVNPEQRANQYVVQWYVIDPNLANFRTSTAWNPQVVASGRIDGGQSGGDRYHPAIGVTEQGVAYIEYTYSDSQTYPQVRRATLSNTYTSVASDTLVQAGPSLGYDGSFWCDYSDMQADPASSCSFWSVHTLVHDPDDYTPATQIDKRDIWLFENAGNCNNSNLNFDGGTDLYDMALFNSFYSTGARRVDMNTDGTTDATDAALYQNAYDAATGP